MIVKFGEEEFACDRAVKSIDKATLYLTKGGTVEFSGISKTTWDFFEITGGSWENIGPSNAERLAALESAMLAMMGGTSNV